MHERPMGQTKGLATGGVGFWQPPRPETEEDRREMPTQGRLIVDLALESRGIFTAITGTSLVLTTAIALLLWFYPSMYGDKEAQDVLVTGILIAPALVTSFVVANREPGVLLGGGPIAPTPLVREPAATPQLCRQDDRSPRRWPRPLGLQHLAGSSLLTFWLCLTWASARWSERTQARSAEDTLKAASTIKSTSRAPRGDFVVPTRHGKRHSVRLWRLFGFEGGAGTSRRASVSAG